MPQATADALAAAYVFLRQVEHRIQYLDDQQTHLIPTEQADLDWIAATMGFDDTPAFQTALAGHRETVAQEFDILLGGSTEGGAGGAGSESNTSGLAMDLDSLLPSLTPDFAKRVVQWSESPRVLGLRDDARLRLVRLVERTGAWVEEGRVTELSALRLADWIEPLLRRESYLAMLQERPSVHQRLMRLLGAAKWPARYLLKHPGVIDERVDG